MHTGPVARIGPKARYIGPRGVLLSGVNFCANFRAEVQAQRCESVVFQSSCRLVFQSSTNHMTLQKEKAINLQLPSEYSSTRTLKHLPCFFNNIHQIRTPPIHQDGSDFQKKYKNDRLQEGFARIGTPSPKIQQQSSSK